jgi:DNA-binding response OmpR family regulator
MSVKKILTVSDTPVIQRFLQYNLTERGYRVTSTPNNRGQLKTALQEELPDMVILDVMMPTLEGIELCLYIKQQFDIPILVISASGSSINKFRGVDLHSGDCLTEPFGILDLVTRIDNVVSSNA